MTDVVDTYEHRNVVDKYVGKKIKEGRNMRGVTQEELAKAGGVSFQQIQKYEKGVNRVSSGKLYEFAKFLMVDISYFFDGIDNYELPEGESVFAHDKSAPNDFLKTKASSDEVDCLINLFKNIKDSDVRKSVIALLAKLKEK